MTGMFLWPFVWDGCPSLAVNGGNGRLHKGQKRARTPQTPGTPSELSVFDGVRAFLKAWGPNGVSDGRTGLWGVLSHCGHFDLAAPTGLNGVSDGVPSQKVPIYRKHGGRAGSDGVPSLISGTAVRREFVDAANCVGTVRTPFPAKDGQGRRRTGVSPSGTLSFLQRVDNSKVLSGISQQESLHD
ncbi:hypothetical protein Bbelb_157110 [Branchiostoma belcheri]|nr:hypothetical protein Bbelb_157110 [Branchiostoma belcheri]